MSKQVYVMPAPAGTYGVYGVAGVTGALVNTLAPTNILYAFQWTNPTYYAILDLVTVSVTVSGAITTAVSTGLEIVPVRDFFNAYTGGTRLNTVGVTGHEMKLKSNFPTSLVNDIRIATTVPLTLPFVPGTEDGTVLGQTIFGTGTAVGTTALASTPLFDRTISAYPFIMSTFEGFVIRMALTGPATGTIQVSVSTRWFEIAKQVF